VNLASLEPVERAELESRFKRIEEALYAAGLLERPVEPKPVEIPSAKSVEIKQRFRGSIQHPHTVIADWICPVCEEKQNLTTVLHNPGVILVRCDCGEKAKLDLQW